MVMTARKAQADVLLRRLRYALPGWDAAVERWDAHKASELHGAAQTRAWADRDFDADHDFGLSGARAARLIRAGSWVCWPAEGEVAAVLAPLL